MVQSGLNDNDLYVSHIRLAWHFMAAMVLISYALIFGLKLSINEGSRLHKTNAFNGALLITTLIVLQLVFGAFMAGLKAATAAPTWPDINGSFVPAQVFNGNFLHQVVYDKLAIHFVHRTLAYIIAFLILAWWFAVRNINSSPAFNKVKNFTVINVIVQVVLGILTVLNSTTMGRGSFGWFEWFAQLHQLMGMLLLLNMVAVLYMLSGKRVVSNKFA
jgi:cytochrome c oxidase assembly protein subunit 15